ncbi:hypothetical protein HOY80DRAFT_1032112 [Tuber brumale]|nr:hypothetical protein HOY80DRAFT_1032112 [Tuber brumale]
MPFPSLTSPRHRPQRLTSTPYFKLLTLLWLLVLLPIPFTAALLSSKMRRYALVLHGVSVAVLTLITMGCALYYYKAGIELEDVEDRRQIEDGEAKLEWGMQIIFQEPKTPWSSRRGRNVGLVPLVKVPEKAWVDARGMGC